MGDCYREYLKAQAKKGQRASAHSSHVPRSEAAERAAIRKEYFRVARARHRKATPGQVVLW